MELRLLVLRTGDTKKLADFYAFLGLSFEYHKHGNSVYHYSAFMQNTILEIYPLAKNQVEADKNLRLGFGVNDFEAVIANLKNINVTFSSEPEETDFGFMAVVVDPDGRKIELYRNSIQSKRSG
jgi:lactoylglutathione lyase